MRIQQKKQHGHLYTALVYGIISLLVMSAPASAVYADTELSESASVAAPSSEVSTKQSDAVSVAVDAESVPKNSHVDKEDKSKYPKEQSAAEWQEAKKVRKTNEAAVAAQETSMLNAAAVSGSGSESSSQAATVSSSSTPTSTALSQSSAAIATTLDSIAKSGNAEIIKNTSAGDATTGSASATATVINNVNSFVLNRNNTEAASFVTDVMGDANGDIILQPMLLKAMLEANAAQPSTHTSSNTTGIQNDINLTAVSGNATVQSNTSAGNASTGSANTVADVVNIVNSMVSAHQSFIGTVNIYGNLNGDILIAPDFIPQMIANNTQLESRAGLDNETANATANNTQSIVNNVALAAQSGQALVDGNTTAGNASSGDADTNLVVFNLSGHEVVARDSLLVFINVLGKWVGVIVDAPTGATAAAIGSGVAAAASHPSVVIETSNDTQVTNNINLISQSGNAAVVRNTTAGSATSGNATASANILNMTTSQLNMSGWFGILFINVFGTWNGSFGIDTSAGMAVDAPRQNHANKPAVIQFRANSASTVSTRPAQHKNMIILQPGYRESSNGVIQTAAALTDNPRYDQQMNVTDNTSPNVLGQMVRKTREVNTVLVLGSIVVIGVSLYALRRILM